MFGFASKQPIAGLELIGHAAPGVPVIPVLGLLPLTSM